MSWKAFRVRKGLHSDAKIKIDGDGSAGSAIENRGALSALTSPSLDSATTHDQGGAVLVLDNDKQISFRTGFELKEDIKSSVDVRAGFGIHFSNVDVLTTTSTDGPHGNGKVHYIGQGGVIDLAPPGTLSASSSQSAGTRTTYASAQPDGHTHVIEAADDITGSSYNTDATSLLKSDTTGKLKLRQLETSGDAIIGGNFEISGDLTVLGTTSTASSQNTTIGDTVIALNYTATGQDTLPLTNDTGLLLCAKTGTGGSANGVMLWDQDYATGSGRFALVQGAYQSETVGEHLTVASGVGAPASGDITQTGSLTWADLKSGPIVTEDPGAGGEGLNIGGSATGGWVNIASGLVATSSGGTDAGSIVTAGGIVAGENLILSKTSGTALDVQSSDNATSPTSAALLVAGGVHIGKDIVTTGKFIGNPTGQVAITAPDANLTSTTAVTQAGGNWDASFQTAGGARIADHLSVGAGIYATTSVNAATITAESTADNSTTAGTPAAFDTGASLVTAGSFGAGKGAVIQAGSSGRGILTDGFYKSTDDEDFNEFGDMTTWTAAGSGTAGANPSISTEGGAAIKKSLGVGGTLHVGEGIKIYNKSTESGGATATGEVMTEILPFSSAAISNGGTLTEVVSWDTGASAGYDGLCFAEVAAVMSKTVSGTVYYQMSKLLIASRPNAGPSTVQPVEITEYATLGVDDTNFPAADVDWDCEQDGTTTSKLTLKLANSSSQNDPITVHGTITLYRRAVAHAT